MASTGRLIDVAFTRAYVRPADVAVVIDVLRASSTATQALASGYRRVLFAETLPLALSLRRAGTVLAGERQCVTPTGFDQGNSPLEAAQPRGIDLVLATTNGAPGVVMAARRASHVLIGCLLNLDAVIESVHSQVEAGMSRVLLVCAGTDDAPALEDSYVAGRISAALDGPRTDAALIAEAVSRAYQTPLEALDASADADVLRSNGLETDIAYCARTSELACVPVVVDARAGIATVADTRAKRLAAVVDVSEAPISRLDKPEFDDSDTVNA